MNDTVSEPRVVERKPPASTIPEGARTMKVPTKNAAERLRAMAATFEERNALYGDTYLNIGRVLRALFPNGIELNTEDDFNVFFNFVQSVNKITRLASTGMTHVDSAHDCPVYLAMVESLIDGARDEVIT